MKRTSSAASASAGARDRAISPSAKGGEQKLTDLERLEASAFLYALTPTITSEGQEIPDHDVSRHIPKPACKQLRDANEKLHVEAHAKCCRDT